MEDGFEEWLKTKPKVIQDLARKYPPAEYVIKQGAPYGVTVSGTKVVLYSYLESGEVSVVVRAKDKKPEAIEHERKLGEKYGKSAEEMEKIYKSDVQVVIDPQWLGYIN